MSSPLPDALTYTVQRPSMEVPQQEGSTSGHKQEFKLNATLTDWLRDKGIPVYNERLLKLRKTDKKNSTTNITASNVSTSELQQHLRWRFYDPIQLQQDNNVQVYCEEVVSNIKSLSEFVNPPLFHVPWEWQDSDRAEKEPVSEKTTNELFWRQSLLRLLSLHDPNRTYYDFAPRPGKKSMTSESQSTIPNISLMYNEDLITGGIAWAMTNFLASPTFMPPGPDTEMKVEHLISPGLSGFFNISGCKTTSNAELKFKPEISCFGSHSRPDFATRVKREVVPDNYVKQQLNPVVMLGEAKPEVDSFHIDISSDQTKHLKPTTRDPPFSVPVKLPQSRLVAQLAHSAYSSLVIIIVSLITQWRESQLPKKGKGKKYRREDYKIPSYAVVYGVGYGANGVLPYAFFPYITEWGKDEFPKSWGFISALVSEDFSRVFTGGSITQRLRLAGILLRMQQHANQVKEKMRSIKLPEIFFS